ncbi:hypothetical protein Tco_0852496, partial [Tanacetum coccineum]
DDEVAWWVDSGATSHVCKDLRWFHVCKSIEDGSFVKIGNVATEPINGIGRVLLTFTSGKTLCLDNVLYVPGIRNNLVYEIVLNKCGYKQVLESDKYILSRHGSFVGFGYVMESKDLSEAMATKGWLVFGKKQFKIGVMRSAHLFGVIMIIIRGEAPSEGGPGAALAPGSRVQGAVAPGRVQGAVAPGRVQGAAPLAGVEFYPI